MANESVQVLEQRLAELSDEIRHYPTPIARCDDQLLDLLERRSRVLARLREIDARQPASRCTEDAIWINDGGLNAA
jgi:chorismate mutase